MINYCDNFDASRTYITFAEDTSVSTTRKFMFMKEIEEMSFIRDEKRKKTIHRIEYRPHRSNPDQLHHNGSQMFSKWRFFFNDGSSAINIENPTLILTHLPNRKTKGDDVHVDYNYGKALVVIVTIVQREND